MKYDGALSIVLRALLISTRAHSETRAKYKTQSSKYQVQSSKH